MKMIKLGINLDCGTSLSEFKATSKSLNCGIFHRKLEATTSYYWAPVSHALMPNMKLVSLGKCLTATSPVKQQKK
jgi:hypothetical protein